MLPGAVDIGHRGVHRYHPTIGYQYMPSIRTRLPFAGDDHYLVRTNAQGFRSDHDFSEPKRPGTFRILLFGDSFSAGVGVSNGRRYSDYLEELVPGVEVFNCGLEGTGTDQQYLAFREVSELAEYDLVIVAPWVENIRRNPARYRMWSTSGGEYRVFPKPYFSLDADGQLRLHNVPVPQAFDASELDEDRARHLDQGGPGLRLRQLVYRLPERHRLKAKERIQRLTRYQPVPGYDRPTSPEWLLMRAILERWADEAAAPLLVMPIPMPQHVDGTASSKQCRRRFEELREHPRIAVHDPLPDLRRHPASVRRGFRHPLDPHPSPAGHRALAESLAPRIRALVRHEAGTAA